MANDLTSNPWIIDTAASTVISTILLRVKNIRWVGGVTAGDQAILTDQNGKVKWKSLALGGNNVESDLVENTVPWDGLKCPTLTSGVLYVEYA